MADRFGQFDEQSARRIGEVVRYVEAMMRGGSPRGRGLPGPGQPFEFAKLNQAVTAGVLTGGETASVWLGPAWGGSDADTGIDIELDYATNDMASGDYCVLTRQRGKWYVQPWECPT